MRLREIWIHPVKSLGGTRVARARIDDRGIVFDRRFMVIDTNGRFVTQREHAQMANLAARIDADRLLLSRPREGQGEGATECAVPLEVDGPERDVVVWKDTVRAIDAGDEPARFLSDALSLDVRLVRMPSSTRRAVDPRYATKGELVSFADGFPFLLITDGSLAALNARLDTKVDARRFRPNLVIEGAGPFAEETWREIRIRSIRFFVAKHCSRCTIVNVDPDTGVRGLEPLAALADLNKRDRQVFFGENLFAEGEGEIAEGDDVVVIA
jgi:uncharacterized protein YcbX